MRTILTMLCVALTAAAAVPAQAVTLEPGTYKLEWQVPETGSEIFQTGASVNLRQMSADEAKKIEGLSSTKYLSGENDRFKVILDESKGTGKGYDTAYVLPVSDAAKVDLKQAAKVLLAKDKLDMLCSDEKQLYTMDVQIGEKGSQVTQKAAIDLRVRVYPGDRPGDRMYGYALVAVRGCWAGKIKTDAGDLDVRLLDVNGNGAYGDKMGGGDEPWPTLGDAVFIGDIPKEASFEIYGNILFLSNAALYDGKLYALEASKLGDTLEVKPFTGNAGILRIDAKDGYDKPTERALAMLFSKEGVFYSKASQDIALPVGRYDVGDVGAVFIIPKQSGPPEKQFGIKIRLEKPIKIAKDKTCVLKVGGPVTLKINPDKKVLKVKRGQELDVNLIFTVGGGVLGGVEGDRKAKVNIRDAKGKLLKTGEAGFG